MKTFGRDDEGLIHDSVFARPGNVRVTVIAGDERMDTMSIQLHAENLSVSMLIHAQDARELGRLLTVAADDTESR